MRTIPPDTARFNMKASISQIATLLLNPPPLGSGSHDGVLKSYFECQIKHSNKIGGSPELKVLHSLLKTIFGGYRGTDMLRLTCTILSTYLEETSSGTVLLWELDALLKTMETGADARGVEGVRAWVDFMAGYVKGKEFQLGMEDEDVVNILGDLGIEDNGVDCGGGRIVGRDFVVRVVKCFLDAVDERRGKANLHFKVTSGYPSSFIGHVKGMVLDTPYHAIAGWGWEGVEGKVEVGKCAVFSCSLVVNVGRDETRKTENAVNYHFKSPEKEEERVIASLFERIMALGLKYVFCQRLLHPTLTLELSKAGVTVFHRLGAKRVDDVARISGCFVVEDWRSWMMQEKVRLGNAEITAHKAADGKVYPLLLGREVPIATFEVTGFDSVVTGRVKEKVQEMVVGMERLWVDEVVMDWKGALGSWERENCGGGERARRGKGAIKRGMEGMEGGEVILKDFVEAMGKVREVVEIVIGIGGVVVL
ncbi:hypothetical protein TrRE_jg8653 [Triparma retinervis]|jgi:hypothetical protein|uniref:Uncharacterized protein n=1 Tax=Triparma retinervis TaxID=2557542 RepID=A0A9W7A9U4_9STRA|nr:hypothetical protein TrRE_jg8653 [Triparma retinervis]